MTASDERLTPPGTAHLVALAEQALADIPDFLRRPIASLAIRVEEFADDDTLDDMGIESPFDLLGLYVGVPLTERSFTDSRGQPDTVLLFRRAILDYWCETGLSLADVVRHVLIHEIGHHYGYSDADMERIEAEA